MEEEKTINLTETNNTEKKKTPAMKALNITVSIVLIAVIVMLAGISVFNFILFKTTVVGPSMQNTYNINLPLSSNIEDYENSVYKDVVYYNRFLTPNRSDIVIISEENKKPIIKRVIALGGDQIDIRLNPDDNNCYVYLKTPQDEDFTALDEPYIKSRTDMFFVYSNEWLSINGFKQRHGLGAGEPYTVPQGEIFVMGDNRRHSDDSVNYSSYLLTDVKGVVVINLKYNQSLINYFWHKIFG